MFTSKRVLVASAIALSALGTTGAVAASASAPVYSTTQRTEVLTSGRCYHEHQVTTTWYSWSSKAGHYIRLVSPRVTTTDSTHCHS